MTYYEWDIETVDLSDRHNPDPDIIDHNFSDTCPGIPSEPELRLVLVRESDRDFKSWAYVENGKLPEFFLDAHQVPVTRVPQRFHKELANAIA